MRNRCDLKRGGLVVLTALLFTVPPLQGCSNDDEYQERMREMRAARSAAWTLRDKIQKINPQISFKEELLRDPPGYDFPESEMDRQIKREIEDLKSRRRDLQRQLDYIDTYHKLPPDSFFKEDGTG